MNPRAPAAMNLLGFPIQGIAAGQQDPDPRVDPFQLLKRFGASHTGHEHIQDDQIDAVPLLAVNLQGLETAFGRQDLVPQLLQNPPGHQSDAVLIIHQENGAGPSQDRIVPG